MMWFLSTGSSKLYKYEGYLRPRTKTYLLENRRNFVTLIDQIVVGCVEKKIIDPQTVEVAAGPSHPNFAISV